jgi:hypothetical protein
MTDLIKTIEKLLPLAREALESKQNRASLELTGGAVVGSGAAQEANRADFIIQEAEHLLEKSKEAEL